MRKHLNDLFDEAFFSYAHRSQPVTQQTQAGLDLTYLFQAASNILSLCPPKSVPFNVQNPKGHTDANAQAPWRV